MRRPRLAAWCMALLLALAGSRLVQQSAVSTSVSLTAPATTSADSATTSETAEALSGTLTIFAATSLKAAFDDLTDRSSVRPTRG